MPFIGNQLSTSFQNVETQTITGDGSTGYTLNNAVADGKDLLVYINNVKQEEGSGKAYTASGTTITFSDAVASTDSCYVVFIGQAVGTVTPKDGTIVSSMLADANLEMPNTLDLNGKELILDADGDSSITSDTDDEIHIKIAGADDFKFKANTLEVQTGSNIDMNGTELILDVDGDSSITSDTDDQIDFRAGGTDVMAMSTTCLTITNASNDVQLTLKSTDADANVGPVLDLYRNSASPADNDRIGSVTFRGRNDNSQDVDYAVFDVFATDVSDGTEDVEFDIRTIKGGTETSSVTFLGTETVFNQASTDLDFRVESDGNANMLFVDAGNNRVGVGSASPA